MKMSDLRVGADPEVFVLGSKGIMNAGLFTEGTKEHPAELKHGVKIHRDNITLEFNFPPADSREKFCSTVEDALLQCRHLIQPNYLLVSSSMLFSSMDMLKGLGDGAFEFRCEPEDNIWGDPTYQNQHPLVRSAGGHIHIGWGDNVDQEERIRFALWMDVMIGCPLVLIEEHGSARYRRTMYGKPGSCRYKPYGIEYRTPGNDWLKGKAGAVWDLVEGCFQRALIEGADLPMNAELFKKLQHAITQSDPVAAKEVIDAIG